MPRAALGGISQSRLEAKRGDTIAYHEMKSVFHPISLCDVIGTLTASRMAKLGSFRSATRGGVKCAEWMLRQEHVSWNVLVDFDGTIAPDDPTDRILERFAEPSWRVLEQAWQAGRISSRECMHRQVDLLRVSPAMLGKQIDNIRIDPEFPAFVEFCKAAGAHVTIVSDGFDRVVRGALDRVGLSLPVCANKLEWQGGDRWRLALPYMRAGCRADAANCKCSHRPSQSELKVVVGDGRSDYCAALSADCVIAKGALADLCRQACKRHATFGDFYDVRMHLADWLSCLAETRASRTSTAHSVASARQYSSLK